MKRETPFKLAAKATLKITQRDTKNDKLLLNSLQGGNDLHRQLAKTVGNTKYNINKTLKPMENTQQQLIRQRSEEQALAQEVAALDNFRVGVTREKTKHLIENIKLRRRQKHLQALSAFKEDLQDYKENLLTVYSSLENDLSQVLTIRQNQLNEYLSSLKVNYLLSRDKQLLDEITKETTQYKQSIIEKIKQSQDDLQRINNERKGGVQSKCQYLQYQISQIAFVLQDEAKSIALKEKESIHELQQNIYTSTKNNLSNIERKSNEMLANIFQRAEELKKQWRQVNQQMQIDVFLKDTDSKQLQWPIKRQNLYKELVELQAVNSKRKLKLISNLALQHPDTITKANIDKWNDHLKIVNQSFNEQLDSIIKQLTEQCQKSEEDNTKRLQQLRAKLNYVENRGSQQVDKLIQEKCLPNYKRNNQNTKQLLKNVINYVQEADEKENGALQKLSQLLGDLGNKTDDFVKKWAASMQQYEVQKAKILDEDDEVVQKLTLQLNQLKQQLRQALHHMKLQEVQKACFDKIDQLQKAYRKTHQKNKDLAAKRPESIQKFMNLFQGKIAESFSLFEQSKKAQLIDKAKKQCEQIATKRYQEQEKKKQEEEAAAAEEIKKKGGKAPPPAKPKDPKKAQAEMEQRKKVLMQEIGLRQIEQVKTGSGSTWLAFKSLTEICFQLYKKQDGSGDDNLSDEIKNYKGDSLVSKRALINAKQMAKQLQILRNNFFLKLGEKKQRVLDEAQMLDNNFLEQSLTQLDKRLRQHYPLKGKLQAEIGVVRSGQITNHKKQYEKHVRIVKQKMDLQTQKFNYLLQKCLQLIKKHNADQKSVKQDLSKGKVLSEYQGCHRKAHQNCKTFLRQTHELIKQLQRLSSIEVQSILNSNEEFLKHTKSLSDGGEFSTTQLQWYKTMMTEVNTQISQQKQKRGQRTKEVQQHIEKRSKELIEAFDKDYNVALQDLSAREGTGKKYGRPKRIAQEKLRFQMNKCEQAQINIDKQIQSILEICNAGSPIHPQKPNFSSWRQKLMALQSCIVRYARHIEAIVNPCKARVMSRVTYNQQTPDAILSPDEQQQDKKRIIQQLLQLGPLGEQKEDKIFMKFLEDIQKIIGDEARAIYVGDKAKYITGNDKLPDFLRLYIQNMRKNAQQFRQESVRNLRQSCGKLSAITGNIVDLYYHGIQSFYGGNQDASFSVSKSALIKIIQENEKEREKNLQQLRPNLANPKCQQELKELDEKQKKRQSQVIVQLKEVKKNFEDKHFSNASKFLYSLLNNYEFLILYFDSIYLFEDFVKVSGDDVQEKVHLDAKRLLLMKQKGISIDASSERNIKKKWESVTCTLFDFGDKKLQLISKPQQQPKQKDKKGAKKDSKANKQQQQAVVNLDQSKAIETVKTWRQKAVFTNRDEVLNRFSKQYRNQLDDLTNYCQKGLKQNQSFKLKWENIAKTLYVS